MRRFTPEIVKKAEDSRVAARNLRTASTSQKNAALESISKALRSNEELIISSNQKDISLATSKGLDGAVLARLLLTKEKLQSMVAGIERVIQLPDPVGEILESRTLPNGIQLEKRRVPLGVIGTIFEARPEVPVDIASLCIKSGNSVVMRGGSEAQSTNLILGKLIANALSETEIPEDSVQMLSSSDRTLVHDMIKMDGYFDLIIPRGGANLIQFVASEATVPAITGGIGVCHIYLDANVDAEMATRIIVNSKVQAPSVCNALDTVLINSAIDPVIIEKVCLSLINLGVELRCDSRTLSLLESLDQEKLKLASSEDYGQEFLNLIASFRMVDSMNEAIQHIEKHGSGHSEAIITNDVNNGHQFTKDVDAALVLVNASTRFNDGGQIGLGSEVAISTGKLHARGPMGLRELTSYKWVALGAGQIRD